MAKIILWQRPDGAVWQTVPNRLQSGDPPLEGESEDQYLNRIATKAQSGDPLLAECIRLPNMEETDLPVRTYRNFWRYSSGTITVDVLAAQQTLQSRVRAKAADLIDQLSDAQAIKDRAMLLVMMDEINLLRDWITTFKAAVAAATNLANLQTRVAALANVPQRTANQIRPAVQGKMTDGSADS